MAKDIVMINRAPVLTLWAAVVAERLGFSRDESLTLGKCVAGLNAQSKGQRLGIYGPGKGKGKKPRAHRRGEEFRVELCGRAVPAVTADDGVRAVVGDTPIEPGGVRDYLERKFGDELPAVRRAMEDLANAVKPEDLAERAYSLYEEFRPRIPAGKRGWGAKGELDLTLVRSLS